jgi:PAS domain S-box-containing protein
MTGEITDRQVDTSGPEGSAALGVAEGYRRELDDLRRQVTALQAEVAERQRLQEDLRRSEQELRDFVENATEGLHWVAADGRIVWANRAELELVGYAADEFIGHHISEFHADQDAIRDILCRLANGEALREYEARLRAKDGSIKHVLLNSSVYRVHGDFIHTRCFTRDITERKRAEETTSRLAAIVQSSDDAIIGKTLDGIIVDWNQGAERLYGYTPDEVIGRPISLLIPEDRPDELPAIMARLRRGERIDHYETERITKDGRRLDISVTISPIRDGSDRLIGASAVARNISERKQAEKERELLLSREQQARTEAEAAIRLRDEFLLIASHELRTPLATLSTHAQLAIRRLRRDGPLEPEHMTQALQAIVVHSEKLTQLLSQLLDVSRLEAGRLKLVPEPTDLTALVAQVVADTRVRSDRHLIRVDVPSFLQASVDRLRLEQVLRNLLDNAVKYSPDGGPIELAARQDESAVELSVRDHGLGIQPERRARLFERYFQAHNDAYRSGLGLGLYISRQIVELHGGQIRAEFPQDGGTRMVVRLPLAR